MEQARQTRDEAEGIVERLKKHSPAASQVVGFFALLTTGGIALFLGGLAIAGIVITLVLLTPVFLFFSPILVPAGIILFLCVAGVLTAAGAGVTFLSVVSWVYNYFKGRHPPGAEQLDYARRRAMETTETAKQKARELGSQAQSKAAAPSYLHTTVKGHIV
ncbi:hypothetical protein GOP47_0006656 [Adiantum capillus-veneris]|uniref:Oleosin n=1 Tax=Adiantum capillus-veneris TaxID=13818 RepID=A0A9D4ZN86_ADICA|nr:hypothetical protein GOP47_0006656 [Adiantum capillus-veneris]